MYIQVNKNTRITYKGNKENYINLTKNETAHKDKEKCINVLFNNLQIMAEIFCFKSVVDRHGDFSFVSRTYVCATLYQFSLNQVKRIG